MRIAHTQISPDGERGLAVSTRIVRPTPWLFLLLTACVAIGCTKLEANGLESGSADADASGDANIAVGPDGVEPLAGLEPLQAPEHTAFAVARTLVFERELEDGVAHGFDLDAAITESESDDTGCGRLDFESPGGEVGIDNQFARLLPLIENAGGAALESYVQEAINEGDLLIAIELEGLDDAQNDDDVAVNIMRGLGTPLLGANGFIEPWQSYDIDTASPWSRVEGATVHDGVLEAGPFELVLPIFVFDFVFEVTLIDASMRLELGPDGPVSGVIGGAITIENMLDIANNIEGGENIPILIEGFGASYADLQPDSRGRCEALSATVSFDSVPAYVYVDADRFEF